MDILYKFYFKEMRLVFNWRNFYVLVELELCVFVFENRDCYIVFEKEFIMSILFEFSLFFKVRRIKRKENIDNY